MSVPKKILALFAFALSLHCHGNTIQAFGETVEFRFPSGYCAWDFNQAEGPIYRQTVRAMQSSSAVRAAADCEELRELRQGRRTEFDRYILVAVPSKRKIHLSRESYLQTLMRNQDRIAAASRSKDVTERLEKMSRMRLKADFEQFLGRDGNAAYMVIGRTIQSAYGERKGLALMASTIVNEVPVSVMAYDFKMSPRQGSDLRGAVRETLNSILTSN